MFRKIPCAAGCCELFVPCGCISGSAHRAAKWRVINAERGGDGGGNGAIESSSSPWRKKYVTAYCRPRHAGLSWSTVA
jgi:hypothetical protein